MEFLSSNHILVMLLIGVAGGLTSGLTGMGGGIIVVPALLAIFGPQSLSEAIVISFFAVFVNSISATLSKRRHYETEISLDNYIELKTWSNHIKASKIYIVGAIVSTLIVAFVFGWNKKMTSELGLAMLQVLLAIAISINADKVKMRLSGNKITDVVFGSIVGAISTLMGGTGGTYTILYFHIGYGKEIKDCTVVSNFTGIFIGLMSIVGYFSSFLIHNQYSGDNIINIIGSMLLITMGGIGSWVGAKYQKKFDNKLIKKFIVVILLLSASYTLYSYFILG